MRVLIFGELEGYYSRLHLGPKPMTQRLKGLGFRVLELGFRASERRCSL